MPEIDENDRPQNFRRSERIANRDSEPEEPEAQIKVGDEHQVPYFTSLKTYLTSYSGVCGFLPIEASLVASLSGRSFSRSAYYKKSEFVPR